MGQRWDLTVSSKDKHGKWRSNRVGVIFEGKEGRLEIRIDPGVALSTPEGVLVTGYLPRERDEGARSQGPRSGASQAQPSFPADDSEIPF